MKIVFPTQQEAQRYNKPCVVMRGIGKVYASMCATELILSGAKRIVLMGTCGAIDNTPVLTPVIATKFYEWDMDCSGLGYEKGVTPFSLFQRPVIHSVFTARIQNVKNAYYGKSIMSGDTFADYVPSILSPFIDMESAAMAKVCREYNIEFVSIKIVTDNANHDSKNNWHKNLERASEILNEAVIGE